MKEKIASKKLVKNKKTRSALTMVVLFSLVGVLGLGLGMNLDKLTSSVKERIQANKNESELDKFEDITKKVLPDEGFELPVSWGDVGPKLIEIGAIDQKKFEEVVQMSDEEKEILTSGKDVPIKINSQNGQFVVDLLWALGLAQKSVVYTQGPLGQEYKAEQGSFASTGGWTLAKGDATSYLNKYDIVNLTAEQQVRVGEIAKNVYRPCCGNSTWFPDCNHGMAALAAIELMVAKGMSDEDIYKNVLKLNSFWFPDSYLTVAIHLDRKGTSWEDIDAKEVLGETYSSGQGFAVIAKEVGPLPGQTVGGSCGA